MTEQNKILFITLSNVGDLVMTTPVLECLHRNFPLYSIDIIADQRSSKLLEGCPYHGTIFHKRKKSSWREQWQFLSEIRRTYYDVVVDLRGPILGRLVRADQRGFKRASADDTMHAVEHHFTALDSLITGRAPIPAAKLWLTDAAVSSMKNKFEQLDLGRCLALAPGANWPGKIWPAASYTELIHHLKDSFDSVCLYGAPEDKLLAETICEKSPLPCLDLCGDTDLLEAAAGLARASVFVGNDSGLGHIAAALEIPTVTVFGIGHPARYRPWGRLAEIVIAPNNDLNALSAKKVAAAVLSHTATERA